MMYHSENLNELATSLSAYQAEAKNPANTAKNPFLKNRYAPLNDILNMVRPELARQGLSISQLVGGEDRVGVTTILLHTSGQWISDTISLTPDSSKGLSTAQNAGVVITYLRRYAVQAILGISGEDDTDGHEADTTTDKPAVKPKPAQPNIAKQIKDAIAKIYEPSVSDGFRDEAKAAYDLGDCPERAKRYEGLLTRIDGYLQREAYESKQATGPDGPEPDLPESTTEEDLF
jgi:hypothetical protein